MSELNQSSFLGGMNLLADDVQLKPNQYRVGFNVRNRFDSLVPCFSSVRDTSIPTGIIQEITTFGNYLIAFVSGNAYYRFFSNTGWTQIVGFSMSNTAPRYWTKSVPVSTTLYGRLSNEVVDTTVSNATGGINFINATSGSGSNPGLVVQDGVNQPQFIFLVGNIPTVRTTQTFSQWSVTYVNDVMTVDAREYVPVGTFMEWLNGVLFIVGTDGESIYRSVSGRPLDFVINVNPDGSKGGNATTTSYSVGVGGISCIRSMSDGSLFVSAANAICFSVQFNTTANAPTIFGEYTFIRKFLFNAGCLSDRVIIDALGDTQFIDLTGVRSFNAVLQLQNEGRNSVFSSIIQSAFMDIIQSSEATAAINFDNYSLFAMNTIFGQGIAVYDTINECWSGFDISQTGGIGIKQLIKLEVDVQRCYAVTTDNKFYDLYARDEYDVATVRFQSMNSTVVQGDSSLRLNNPRMEVKPTEFRCILNNITENTTITAAPFVNNRLTPSRSQSKVITYVPPVTPYTSQPQLQDVNTQLTNLYFTFPDCSQGWKAYVVVSWSNGATLTQFSMTAKDETPMNPLNTQATTI